jgi:hypothetical protein
MNFAVVDKQTLNIKNVYWSDSGVDETRPDYNESVVHVQVPEGLDYWCIKSLPDFTIIADVDAVLAKKEQKFSELRKTRTTLLAECDWTQVNDSPMSSEKKAVWAQYRQALRDLPDTTRDPTDVTWPTPPS